MAYYGRARIPGATYFFTVTLRDRQSSLLTKHVDVLREVFQFVRRRSLVRIDALVVLPDHLLTVWTSAEGDDDFSRRWRAIKGRFTRVRGGIAHERDRSGEYALATALLGTPDLR
jgi:REP-associated tyrosine transposase